MAKKLKDVIKTNPEPARGTVGVNPLDPWSAKANIAEDSSLGKYLLSRGINPKFVSTQTKISHAKSSAFLKWKQDHQFEEVEALGEDALLDKFLMSRGINPKYATKEMKISHSKSGQFLKWKRDHMFEEIQTEEVDKQDTITFDIPLFIRVLEYAREDAKDDMALHKMTERLIAIRDRGTLTMADYDFITKLKEEMQIDESALEKWRKASAEREQKHKEIEKKQSKDGSGMSSAIDRLQKQLNKEDVYQDPLAATQTVFDGGNNTNDIADRKSQLSKSARMIKALYKHLNMKEETYDWEKDDKSVQTYGKKPKLQKTEPDANLGEKKPSSRVVMSGGKTLTGEKRDTVEIDPLMKDRPDLDGNIKPGQKEQNNK